MKLLVDNNISPLVARTLRAALTEGEGHVEHIRERFGPGVKDEDWLQALGSEGGWAVLTADHRISRRPHEKAIWRSTDLVIFFLEPAFAKLPPREQAGRLILRWEDLVAAFGKSRPPAGFRVRLRGRLETLSL